MHALRTADEDRERKKNSRRSSHLPRRQDKDSQRSFNACFRGELSRYIHTTHRIRQQNTTEKMVGKVSERVLLREGKNVLY